MLNKNLIFVTGKGGVGKSTVSLYLARKLSLMGRKTLLVELGTRSSIQYLAEMTTEAHYQPQKTAFGFDWALLSGLDCLMDYVSSFVKVESLTKYFFDNPVMKTLLDIAPGLDDLAILGKLTSDIRNHGPSFQYDHIVVDSHSTGSFVSMLSAPKLLSQMVASGPLHSQSQQISDIIMNQERVHTLFVGLLEELPVDELVESSKDYEQKFNNQYSILLNKVLPDVSLETASSEWAEFIAKKIEKQKVLQKELQNHFPQVYVQDFVTQDTKNKLLSYNKGDEIFRWINL